jgi:periplasmic protein TonB
VHILSCPPRCAKSPGSNLAEKIGRIFNPEDLDRAPEPVLQPAPVYPHAMKREGLEASVMVEFVVDTDGRVLAPAIVESTHHSFDDAALAGVARWKFRAGVRGGKKVPSRMRVPIVFKTIDVEI